MAVDTAEKRISALKFNSPWLFGTVPSGTVDRYAALWAYSGISAVATVPTHSIAFTIYGPDRAVSAYGPKRTVTAYSPTRTIEIGG